MSFKDKKKKTQAEKAEAANKRNANEPLLKPDFMATEETTEQTTEQTMQQKIEAAKQAEARQKIAEENADEWETVSSKDGKVVILENAGEFFDGVWIGYGRDISGGEGHPDKKTRAFVPLDGEIEKVIIPESTVLNSTFEFMEKNGVKPDGKTAVRIILEAPKGSEVNGKKIDYHLYKVLKKPATREQTARAEKFLPLFGE